MQTQCIEVSLNDDPMEVLKGCVCILSSLRRDFTENDYSYYAIAIISDLTTDAVSRLDEKLKGGNDE